MSKIIGVLDKYKSLSTQLKATLWFLICSFLQRGISVIVTPIYTRILSSEDYGQFSVFDSWLEIFTILFSLRLCTGVYMRELVKRNEGKEQYTSSLVTLSILLISFWFIVMIPFKSTIISITDLSSNMITALYPIILLSTGFGFWSALQRVKYNYKQLVFATLLISVLQPTLCICFIINSSGDKVLARINGIILNGMIIYLPMILIMLFKGKKFISLSDWKKSICFNVPLLPHFLSQIILNHSDRIMINKFIGKEATGFYSLAYSLAMIMILFNTAIQNTLSPWTYENLKYKNPMKIKKVNHITIVFVGIINLMLILIAPEAIAVFAPSSYQEAVYVIPPVALSVFFLYMYGLFVTIEMYYAKNKYIMFASISGAVLNLVLNYIFIPKYGYIAAAYTTLISYILYAIIHGIVSYRICINEKFQTNCFSPKFLSLVSIGVVLIGFLITALYRYLYLRYGIVMIVIICMFIYRKQAISLFKEFMGTRRFNNGSH